MHYCTPKESFLNTLAHCPPKAAAQIRGSGSKPQLKGTANFYPVHCGGILVEVKLFGMPNERMPFSSAFYGMHIHEYGDCSDAFAHTGVHYNPYGTGHPQHSGDFPPLLANEGYAYQTFYTNRLNIDEIIGKSLIIHSQRDDFTTQPSGDSGTKIACGVIQGI